MVSIETQRALATLGKPLVPGATTAQPRACRVIFVGCWSKGGKVVRLDTVRVNGLPVEVAVLKMDDGTTDNRLLSAASELDDGMLVWRF